MTYNMLKGTVMKIGIVGYDQLFMATVSGLYEFFQYANILRGSVDASIEEITPCIVATSQQPLSFSGFTVNAEYSIDDDLDLDWIILPAHVGGVDYSIEDLPQFLQAQHNKGVKIASVCAGAQWLAESKLLDGKRATTHWKIVETVRERYPNVNWDPQQMLIDEGDIVTTGGVMAWQELALFIIGKEISMELASTVSKMMLIDTHRVVQSPYEFVEFSISKSDTLIAESQKWLHENFSSSITVDLLADKLFLSKRTYVRRFKKATNYTPISYLQELRLQECKRLLESKSISFEEITHLVGYKDVNSFRTLFLKRTGISPKVYREKFSLIITR